MVSKVLWLSQCVRVVDVLAVKNNLAIRIGPAHNRELFGTGTFTFILSVAIPTICGSRARHQLSVTRRVKSRPARSSRAPSNSSYLHTSICPAVDLFLLNLVAVSIILLLLSCFIFQPCLLDTSLTQCVPATKKRRLHRSRHRSRLPPLKNAQAAREEQAAPPTRRFLRALRLPSHHHHKPSAERDKTRLTTIPKTSPFSMKRSRSSPPPLHLQSAMFTSPSLPLKVKRPLRHT